MIKHYCVLDFETGGLNHSVNGISEIGFVILDKDFNEIDSYQSHILPYAGLTYSPEALSVSNMTLERLMSIGKDIKVVAKEVYDKLKPYNKNMTLVCHNLAFDNSFIYHFESYGGKSIDSSFMPVKLCTMILSEILTKNHSLKLSSMCEYFGIEFEGHHNSLPDCRATGVLLKKLTTQVKADNKPSTTEVLKFKL
jgi:DNA polymerase III alpha subunit (gram-positive type)